MRAWRIEQPIEPIPCVGCAETRGKMRAYIMAALCEYGYQIEWKDIRVTRWPDYDAWARRQSWRRVMYRLDVDADNAATARVEEAG